MSDIAIIALAVIAVWGFATIKLWIGMKDEDD